MDYLKLTIRQWRDEIEMVANEIPPDLSDTEDLERRIGTLELMETINQIEREALKYIGPVEFNNSTIPDLVHLIEARRGAAPLDVDSSEKPDDDKINTRREAKKLGIRVKTLIRWKKVITLRESLTYTEIAERLERTEETIKRDIRLMREKGLISE